jgi:hypothetical protein
MKNADCVIYITTKRGWVQTYRKENNGWTQTCPNGIVRRLSAEQLLSHLLPPLATGNLIVKVERRNRADKQTKKQKKKEGDRKRSRRKMIK